MLDNLIMKVRRRETPFYDNLYHTLKHFNRLSVPSVLVIHKPLYYTYKALAEFIHNFMERVFWIPMFKTQLNYCGDGLRLHNGMPLIEGSNLNIVVGDDVHFQSNTLSGMKVYDHPQLTIGSGTHLGYGMGISVAKEVTIGKNCRFSSFTYVCDNNGHPLDPERRLGALQKEEVASVTIGNNVWISYGAMVLKGTTIGDNSIVAANTVVHRITIPPNSIAFGFPVEVRPIRNKS